MKRRTKISLTVAALLGALFLWWNLKEDTGVGVDSVWWLPGEAHNVTYLKNDVNRIAEFDIEREAFEKWCARRGMPLRVLSDNEHQMVGRCLTWLEHRGVIPAIDEPNRMERDPLAAERAGKNLDAGDLFFEERWDNGGGYTLGYDVKEKRGYYAYSRH